MGSVRGPHGGHRGRLYEVWEVYGDPMGAIGGRLYEVWEVYGDPMGVIGGLLYEVWEVYSRRYAILRIAKKFPWCN